MGALVSRSPCRAVPASPAAFRGAFLAIIALVVASCAPADAPRAASPAGTTPSLHLADLFDTATVEGEPPTITDFAVIDWRFDRPYEPLPEEEDTKEDDAEAPEKPKPADDTDRDGAPTPDDDDAVADDEPSADDDGADPADDEDDPPAEPGVVVHGAEAVIGIEDLAVRDGLLTGTVTGHAALHLERLPDGDHDLHAVELRMAVSAGTRVAIAASTEKELDRADLRDDIVDAREFWPHTELVPGEGMQTYVVELSRRVADSSELRRVLIQPSDAEGATFEIESVRLVTMREHLAGQAANVDWRGLGEIYRQTLLLHVTETVSFDVTLPARPWLDLAIGTREAHPTTFVVHVAAAGDSGATADDGQRLLRRTVTTEDRWEETPLDLAPWAGRRVRLTFAAHSDHEEQVGFFGTLVVRDRDGVPAVDGRPLADAPRGVILILADTLRRDHLEPWGYERPTAPFLTRLAAEGALFKDDIAQGTWTKVSIPSILSSMYPTSNGVRYGSDKLPTSVTTLAENFQRAGYATFATSSVLFSGRSSNLHQGIDVLHERGSIGELDHSRAKTARTFVDRLTEWIEGQADQPFFAFLHVFDPHSPFDTYRPYDGMWSSPTAREDQEQDIERIEEVEEDIGRGGGDKLPDLVDFEKAGVPHEPFVERELDWYDESIRAMDAEMARLVERLEELGLADRTLIAFTSDHGEEFLEHGRHFHDNHAYGELTNVPLFFWGPEWVTPGSVVDQTVQSIDVYPTLLELCGLPLPPGPQGQSLVPLIRGTAGFQPRPAFAARFASLADDREPDDIGSFAMVSNGFRLVHNVDRPEGHPEFELYDHVDDPLNRHDVAADHPERVQAMARELDLWRKWAESQRVESEGGSEELSEAELEQLRALGYVGDG